MSRHREMQIFLPSGKLKYLRCIPCVYVSPDVGPSSSSLFLSLSLCISCSSPSRKVRCLYAIADVIMARTLRSRVYVCMYVCKYRLHTPGMHLGAGRRRRAGEVPGTGFHLSVPQILLPRETRRGNNPLRSPALSHSPDNAFCERDVCAAVGAAPHSIGFISCARRPSTREANQMKNIHLLDAREQISRARCTKL